MNVRKLAVTVACACVLMTWRAAAEEGHPVKGSWLGTWTGNTTHEPDVILVLNWHGNAITGTINPGTANLAIKNPSVNPDGWVVHFEAAAKANSGRALTYVI